MCSVGRAVGSPPTTAPAAGVPSRFSQSHKDTQSLICPGRFWSPGLAMCMKEGWLTARRSASTWVRELLRYFATGGKGTYFLGLNTSKKEKWRLESP